MPQQTLQTAARSSTCYHGGAFFGAIGPRFDRLDRCQSVIAADVLDAWFDPSPRVIEALREHLPWLARTSPPTQCEGVVEVIAETRGVPRRCVVPGAGSSDLIFLALPHWLSAASRVLILDPTYGEYPHVLERVIGCRVDRFPLRSEDQYEVNIDRLIATAQRGYDLIVLVNPNSPTGGYIDRRRLTRLIDALPPSTRLWVDETYIEYVGTDQSIEPIAAERENVVVCKSMSKVYALSGLRAGYLVAAPGVADELRSRNPPWAVSLPAQLAAVEALKDPSYYRRCYRQTHLLRAGLVEALRSELGWSVTAGVANFVLAELPEGGPTAAELVAACRRRNLFLRDASTMGSGLTDRVVRIAVKDRRTNGRMLDILRDAVAP